jgi:hypothetical protein
MLPVSNVSGVNGGGGGATSSMKGADVVVEKTL